MTPRSSVRILLVYGGRSGEHEVSQRSAASVLKALRQAGYEVLPVGVSKRGTWHLRSDLLALTGESSLQSLPVEREGGGAGEGGSGLPILPQPSQISKASNKVQDVVFPLIHGPLGEDGTLQGLLELADLPYVGCGVLASAVNMDKEVSKRLLEAAGLPVVPYLCLRNSSDLKKVYEQIETHLGGYPVFVKPANMGSSVGVHKVSEAQHLLPALKDAWKYDGKILVEKGCSVREIELSVLQDLQDENHLRVSVPGEIIPKLEFYSYEAKYLDAEGALLKIPADLSEEQVQKAQFLARQAFLTLECEGMARADLFLDRHTQSWYINELNTLPGFTSISMYPKLWEASGLPYPQLLHELIQLALQRHQKRSKWVREYLPPSE